MYDKFFKRPVDYFWEFEYPFGEVFLKQIFDGYKRKYSISGSGIYDLIYIDNKIYEIKFSETKSMVLNDGKKALRDIGKDMIVDAISNALEQEKIDFAVNSGKYITFKIQNKYIAKLEIVKKLKEPI